VLAPGSVSESGLESHVKAGIGLGVGDEVGLSVGDGIVRVRVRGRGW